MLRQSSSTLLIYVNYLIVISININENCRSKRKLVKKKTKGKKRGKLITQNSFTHLFNIDNNDYIYIFTNINEILEIMDKSQKKVGMLSKLLI